MKSTSILAVAALAAVGTSAFAGTFSYADRDIIAVFTKSGSPDVAINLGTPESFDTTPFVNFSSSKYNATTQLLNQYGGSLTGVSFTIFGIQAKTAVADRVSTVQNSSWLAVADANSPGAGQSSLGTLSGFSSGTYTPLKSAIGASVGFNAVTGALNTTAGLRLIASNKATDSTENNGTVLVVKSTDAGQSTDAFSVKNVPGSAQHPGVYNTKPGGNALNNTAGGTSAFYQFSPSSSSTAAFLGTFNLDSSTGVLSYTAVPEPGDYGMIAGGALIAGAMLRRRLVSR